MGNYSDLIQTVVACFDDGRTPVEGLLHYSYMGLVKALDNYCPNNPMSFNAYARAMMAGEIHRRLKGKMEVTLVIEIKDEVCTPVSDVAITHANDLCDRFKRESRLRVYADGYEQALKDLGVRKAPDVGASKGSIQNGH